ncbi:MAG: hypothetical protein GX446_02260 [Chthonomonadales bacterium]|nr:hypothetical protein [Chthonomonadales bacterium]
MDHRRQWVFLATAVITSMALSGCGGGGDVNTSLSGVVTDADGKPVAGARVTVMGGATTSLSNGTFAINGVGVGYRTVGASVTIEGRRWSGETVVDIVKEQKNRSVNIMVSDDRYHARLTGTVIDPSGFALEGAKVFVGGPWGSTMAVTNAYGNYEVRKLTPGLTYTVTCSLAGYVNDERTVTLAANESRSLSFALSEGSFAGTIPAPQNPAAQAWTISSPITRSAGSSGYIEWLKRAYRARRGLPLEPRAVSQPAAAASRVTPEGSVIEIDLFWDYRAWDDLFGYAIKRGLSRNPTAVTAVLRDPLATAFFDVDSALTPNVTYHYTIHSLDTIGFPADGRVGPASDNVSANPLQPIAATSPGQNATVTGDPLFRWTPVSGAEAYQVIVWDRFPDLQNVNDPQGVVPLWPADMNNPGASKVHAPATSLTYSGPYLQSGRTCYWVVIAADDGEYSLSVSPIAKFIAR